MSIKNRISSVVSSIRGKFYTLRDKLTGAVKQLKFSPRTKKKLTKAQQKQARMERNRAILGVGLLLVVLSITYSTTVIYIGVDSSESRIALLPQVVFAGSTLVKAFSKLYK